MDKTFEFLTYPDAANAVLSGYFKKLILALFKHKPKEVYQYIYSHPEIVSQLCHNIHSKSLSEVLSKTLQIADTYIDEFTSFDYKTARREAILALIKTVASPLKDLAYLDEDDVYEAKLNACEVIEEIFQNQQSTFEECVSDPQILDEI